MIAQPLNPATPPIHRRTSFLLAIAAVAVLWFSMLATPATAEQYDLYLLAGQSNMDGRGQSSELMPEQCQPFDDAIIFYRSVPITSDGWQSLVPGFSVPPKFKGPLPSPMFGPELEFARQMLKVNPDRKIALIKGSKGGTSLRVDWNPGVHGEPESQGERYRDFLQTIEIATNALQQRGDTYTIRGLLWHQGESDSKTSTDGHRERLEVLIARLRHDTGAAELPVVVGEVFDNGNRDNVRAAIRAVGTSGPGLGFATSEGTTTGDEGTHFDAASQQLMGQRFAEAMCELLKNPGQSRSAVRGTKSITNLAEIPHDHRRPNVLFMAVDDLNDWVGCMGGNPDAKTPNMDRFAQQSVLFDNAHCQVALCNASRSSLLTGLYASTTGIYGNSSKSATDAYKNATQMPVWFRENGYHTSCMGKIYHNDHGKQAYWDEVGPKTLRWGPEPPEGRQFASRFGDKVQDSLAWAALDIAPGEMPDEQIATWGKAQLDKQHDQPFFLALGFYKPHTPMTAPKRYFDLFDRDQLTLPSVIENDLDDVPEIGRRWVLDREEIVADDAVDQYSPTYRRELVHAYHACVALTDDCVGQVLRHLEQSPHAENTIVVLFSDHGWHLGEKHHWRKWMPWEESTRSPLMVYVPGAASNGRVCHQTVGLIDLYPTLAKLCNLKAPEQLQGQSFDELLNHPTAAWDRPALTSTTAGNHTVRSQRWRYIRYVDGSEELYDHDKDPNEWENLAARSEFQSVKDEHAKWIDKLTAGKSVTPVAAQPKPARNVSASQEPITAVSDDSLDATSSDTRRTPPNVILIMSDDQGWGDVGFNGNEKINTPHLDAMAANGVRFDRFYAAAPLCSPTRGSCLTGRYPFRFGILAAHTGGMRVGEITIAEMLKKQDYQTGFFGKWHMGWVNPNEDGTRGFYSPPSQHGFDEYFATTSAVPTWNPTVVPEGWDSWGAEAGGSWKGGSPYVHDGQQVTENMAGDDSRVIMDRVIPFIESNKDTPFFATVWFHAPHEPVIAGDEYKKPYAQYGQARQNLYGCITAMDEQVGRLREKLRELKIEKSTIVFFCSDNGPADESAKKGVASAGPFKGHKHTMDEGGLLVPACAEWPGVISAGTTTSVRCATIDYFPTIANLVGHSFSKKDSRPIDGIDLMPVIKGNRHQREADLYFGYRRLHEGIDGKAIISGDWKLVQEAKKDGKVQLYNLSQDPYEQTDLYAKLPQEAERLREKLRELEASCQRSRDGADYRY